MGQCWAGNKHDTDSQHTASKVSNRVTFSSNIQPIVFRFIRKVYVLVYIKLIISKDYTQILIDIPQGVLLLFYLVCIKTSSQVTF